MATQKTTPLTAILRSLAQPGADGDAELLNRFTSDHDESAFQAIVRRHGALVLDVCQAVLRNQMDAEDAFQAVFLTLATRAETIRTPASLGAWLHGAAYRIALKAKTAAARRRRHESSIALQDETPPIDPSWAEVRQAIHEEVHRLPHAERAAIVLCYLMGRSQNESVRSLGLTKDGIKKRLERGRGMLRVALSRRGFGAAAILASAAMPLTTVPRALAAATTEMAVDFLRGSAINVGDTITPLIERGPNMFAAVKLLMASTVFAAAMIFTIAITWNEPSATVTAAPRLPERKTDPDAVQTELDGTWKVVAISDHGKDVGSDQFKGLKFTFRKGKLKVSGFPQDKDVTWNPGYIHGAAFKVDSKRKPKEIDFGLDPDVATDATMLGIYQIRKGRLLIAVRPLKTTATFRPRGYATVSGSLISYTLELADDKDGKK